MNTLKLGLFFLLVVAFVLPNFFLTFAAEQKQVVLVNPIRGSDFWMHNFSLTDTPKSQYEIIKKNNFPASWLIRYDALVNSEVQEFLKSLDSNQDIGIFFEVTPSFTRDANVTYNQSDNWHLAKSVLLTGYSPEDRIKLIDTAVKKYHEIFGRDPKSVGAWWIDAFSLGYMKDQYGIEANLDVADQYSTDGYQVWGQYWSTPFYPSKLSALMPAQSEEQKLGVVTLQWATRDPFNGYGNGVFESTYSVQVNDYILHDLGVDYFEKLLNIYPQTTVGLENDFDFAKFGGEYKAQINSIAKLKNQGKIGVLNMSGFADLYIKENPEISPKVIIFTDDPLGSSGKVLWYQTPEYRVGWFYNQDGSVIRDLRIYNDSGEESCYFKACDELKLAFTASQSLDDVNFLSKWILDEGSISNVSVKKAGEGLDLNYKNQAGVDRKIRFLKHDIEVNGKIDTIPGAILKAVGSENNQKISGPEFKSEFDFSSLVPLSFNFLKFLFLVMIFFLIPGLLLVRNIYLAVPLGWVIFTLAAYLLGYLNKLIKLPFNSDLLLWLIPAVSVVVLINQKFSGIKLPVFNKQRLSILFVVLLGSFSWLLTSIKSGILFNYGFGFWGPNGHDGIWHLSLISFLQKNVPPENPIFSGESLSNYHYFFDLLVAKSGSILAISILDLLFRFFPLLISLLAGILVYKFTLIISSKYFKDEKSKIRAAFFAVLFLYFGGSFGWIVTFFRDRSFGGETMFWAQQAISTLLNPPFAISIVIFLAGFLLFHQISQSRQIKWNFIIALTILWGSLIEFKAYAGILTLGALFLFCLQGLILRREFRNFILFFPILILSLVVFLPNNSGSASLIEFKPFWLIESMVTATDRFGWNRLTLTLQSGVWYKIFLGYGLGLLIFIVGNLGTRIISIFSFKIILKERFLFYFTLLSFILPLLFTQKGTTWNIVQFLYYGILILNIFAGIGTAILLRKMNKPLSFVAVVLVVLLTVPTTIGTLPQYLPNRPPAQLSISEIEALASLKTQPEGVVLNLPYDEKARNKFSEPVPLFAYAPTAYVSAFSGKNSFMEDSINLEILDIDYKARLNLIRDFMRIKDQSHKILKDNNISYFYLPKALNIEVDESRMGLLNIFENAEVRIYKVI